MAAGRPSAGHPGRRDVRAPARHRVRERVAHARARPGGGSRGQGTGGGVDGHRRGDAETGRTEGALSHAGDRPAPEEHPRADDRQPPRARHRRDRPARPAGDDGAGRSGGVGTARGLWPGCGAVLGRSGVPAPAGPGGGGRAALPGRAARLGREPDRCDRAPGSERPLCRRGRTGHRPGPGSRGEALRACGGRDPAGTAGGDRAEDGPHARGASRDGDRLASVRDAGRSGAPSGPRRLSGPRCRVDAAGCLARGSRTSESDGRDRTCAGRSCLAGGPWPRCGGGRGLV